MQLTVYILLCSDGTYYTGLTRKDPVEREWEHNSKVLDGYTSTRTPVKLMFTEAYERLVDAIDCEQQIKKWPRRKKEALILGDYAALPYLASRPRRD